MTLALLAALWLTSGALLLSLVAIAWPAENSPPPSLVATAAITASVLIALALSLLT